MATHDYIISNASGASVRADLNNALAAIVSNNSNATSPATTYAYQWWADTTTGQLKLRNSANSAWITIFELDGTMLMEDGSVSAPGLAFASDLNTGFFRSAADKINFATGGAERLEIGSSEVVFNDPSNDVDFRVESNGQTHMLFVDAGNDKVGIGTSTVSNTLDVRSTSANIGLRSTTSGQNQYVFLGNTADSTNAYLLQTGSELRLQQQDNVSGSQITFYTKDSERVRIDSSGRLGIGVSSPAAKLEVQGASTSGAIAAHIKAADGGSTVGLVVDGDSESGDVLFKARSNSSASPSDTDTKFIIQGDGSVGVGTTSAATKLEVSDGAITAGASADVLIGRNSSSFPGTGAGYFKLATNNLDGDNGGLSISTLQSSSLSERLRIDYQGNVSIGTTSANALLDVNGQARFGGNKVTLDTDGSIAGTISNSTTRAFVLSNSDVNADFFGGRVIQVGPDGTVNIGGSAGTSPSSYSSSNIKFNPAGSSYINGGSLGIGLTSPATSLHIQGANTTGKGQLVVSSASAGQEARMTFIDGSDDIAEISTNGDNLYFYNETSSGIFQFYTGGSSERMRLNADGQLIIGGTSAGGSNTKLRVNGDIDHLYNSSSPAAVRKRAISTTFTNLSTTATSMSQGLINNACVVDVFLQNIDADQAVFRFTSGRRNGQFHAYSFVSGSNSNCSVSLSTNVFTITGLGDSRTYTLTMSTSSIGTAPTLKASSTATGETKLAMYSVGAF